MDCSDSWCRENHQCKWDSPVASVWCGNMYSPHAPQQNNLEKGDASQEVLSRILSQLQKLNADKPKQTYNATNRRKQFE